MGENPHSRSRGFFSRAGGIVDDYWPKTIVWLAQVLLILGPIFISFEVPSREEDPSATAQMEDDTATRIDWFRTGWLFTGLGIGMSLVGLVCECIRHKRCSKLEDEIAELTTELFECHECREGYEKDYYELFDDELRILGQTLGFGDSERVSVYKHDSESFVMLGRFSQDPVYNKKGRGQYPADEGAIGKAWRGDEVFISELPDPKRAQKGYEQELERNWGIGPDTASQIRMKSRCYYAKAIEDEKGKRVAVVVFESTTANGLSQEAIRQQLANGQLQSIAAHIARHKSTEPTPSFARQEGF